MHNQLSIFHFLLSIFKKAASPAVRHLDPLPLFLPKRYLTEENRNNLPEILDSLSLIN